MSGSERSWEATRKAGRATVGVAVIGALLLAVACATNPVTGEREVMLISEEQEIALGREADEQVVSQIGVYEDAELGDWVARTGAQLAAASHRPDLPWTFRVLDDETVNAFAIPGGFVYLTRGFLTHTNSEAEVAGVLGHEIGHVAARHSAQRYTQATFAQIGLGVGGILVPEVQAVGGLLQTSVGLLFLKFSRDDERQADELGVEYAHAVGFDPYELAGVFRTFERIGEQRGERLPGWLSTHPDPGDRIGRVRQLADETVADRSTLRVARAEHLRRLDGVVFGPDPREGFVDDDTFKHPDLLFQIDFPAGWEVLNGKTAVTVVESQRRAFMQLTLANAEGRSLEDVARKVVEARRGRDARGQRLRVNDLPAYEVRYVTAVEGLGEVDVTDVFISYRDRVYDVTGLAQRRRFGDYADVFARSQRSFRSYPESEARTIRPDRIRTLNMRGTMTLAGYLEGRQLPVPETTIALINGMELEDRVEAGTLFKEVRAGR